MKTKLFLTVIQLINLLFISPKQSNANADTQQSGLNASQTAYDNINLPLA